jgi:hypothetical protein
MWKPFCVVLVASACLLSSAPGSHATAASGNKLSLDFPDKVGLSVRAGEKWLLKGVMLEANGTKRCKKSGLGKVSVTSDALKPSPDPETTGLEENYAFYENYTIRNTPGKRAVTAVCNTWSFTGYIHVVGLAAIAPPFTGVPVLPWAGAGLGMIGIGWILVFSAGNRRMPRTARGHPAGRPGQVRR